MTDAADKTWPEWKDSLGQTFKPGDVVAVATINGKSPQMVFAEVLRINRVNSRGEPHMITTWDDGDPDLYEVWRTLPFPTDRWSRTLTDEEKEMDRKRDAARDAWQATITRRTEPSCTVYAQPLFSGRGFGRSGRPTTYTLIGNILKIDKTPEDF